MKKYLLFVIFVTVVSFAHAQFLDNLPFPNPDPMTYFQQEMTSLMRFQIEHDVNVPFFVNVSQYNTGIKYNESEVRAAVPSHDGPVTDGESFYVNVMPGFQIRINQYLYVPVFAYLGQSNFYDLGDEGAALNGRYRVSSVSYLNDVYLIGGGLFLNTPVFKGGIYGWGEYSHIGFQRRVLTNTGNQFGEDVLDESGYYAYDYDPFTAKFAILPVVDTAGIKYVGEVLNYFMGFFGMGNIIYTPQEETASNAADFLSTLNVLLDFTFNRIHFDFISLNSRAYYKRGNYDTASKTDRYGAEIGGLLTSLPLGLTLRGGYQHFYYFSPYLASSYNDSIFFDGTVYVDFKRWGSIGATYQYDGVTRSKFIISYTSNFAAGFFGYSPPTKTDKTIDGRSVERSVEHLNPYMGFRFRWGGWNVN